MIKGINDFKNVFFIGVAGVGMSAIAQYLAGTDKKVSGSDRYFKEGEFNETKEKLEAEGIQCFLQNGDGITDQKLIWWLYQLPLKIPCLKCRKQSS